MLGISPYYECVAKVTIMWCTVPEIQNRTDRVFGHSEAFLLLAPDNPENQTLVKMKKHLEISSFYTQRIMMLASWGTQCDSQIFSHFEPFFCSFNPCLPENQNFQYNASSYYCFTHIFWKLLSYNAWLSFWAFFFYLPPPPPPAPF